MLEQDIRLDRMCRFEIRVVILPLSRGHDPVEDHELLFRM